MSSTDNLALDELDSDQGAKVLYSVRSEARKKSLETLLAGKPVFLCDVEDEGAAQRLATGIAVAGHAPLHGIVHSIAFANYSEGFKAFHETKRADFLQATAVSSFSLVEIARAFQPHLAPNASVVTIGISSLLVTPDNYGYMGPIKAALESSVRYLAADLGPKGIRVNGISAGPIKTLAASGIKGFSRMLDYNEKTAPLRRNVTIDEVGNVAAFFFSDLASAITGEVTYVDCGFSNVAVSAD